MDLTAVSKDDRKAEGEEEASRNHGCLELGDSHIKEREAMAICRFLS